MKIVITTGIYPPTIGGPAQYAKNLAEAFYEKNHQVKILTYRLEKYLPKGIRHYCFFFKAFFNFIRADLIIILDTFSVGWPSISAARLLGKTTIIRIAGDSLWEGFVERTEDLVLLRDFYETRVVKLSFKERLIFKITRSTLRKTDHVVFSTDWQRKIWADPYNLDLTKTTIIENYYGKKQSLFPPSQKVFISASRPLKLKNKDLLERAFSNQKVLNSGVTLDESVSDYETLLQRLQNCYAVIVPSISEVSPNLILDALRYNKPFILTRECGLYEKLKNLGLFVDPKSVSDISEKIIFLAEEKNYREYQERISTFLFTHSWREIAEDFLNLIK